MDLAIKKDSQDLELENRLILRTFFMSLVVYILVIGMHVRKWHKAWYVLVVLIYIPC